MRPPASPSAAAWLVSMAAVALLFPGPLAGQGPWSEGGRAGPIVRLDAGSSAPGLDLQAFVGRTQTPRVEIAAAAGLLWLPAHERTPAGLADRERSESLIGLYLTLAAARRIPVGRARLLIGPAVGMGLLRERIEARIPRTAAAPRQFASWRVTPTWSVDVRLRLPEWSALPGSIELDTRLSLITFASDAFIPTLGVGLGWRAD